MKKLNSMPDYTAKLPKSPHDVSQSFTFTSCPGMLLPVYYDMLHHGDEIHFSAAEFVRLNPLHNPALGDIDVHLDYFFVPLSVLYTPSPSMFYQTDDMVSSLFREGDEELQNVDWKNFPVHNFDAYFKTLSGSQSKWPTGYPNFQFDCNGYSQYRLFDFLDMDPNLLLYAFAGSYNDLVYKSPSYTPWFALAYQACYQLHYRNTDRELKSYQYNIDRYFKAGTWTEDAGFVEVGQYNPTFNNIFQIRYNYRYKDYFNSAKVSPMGSSVSMLSDPQSVFNSVNDWLGNYDYRGANASNTGGPYAFGSEQTQTSITSVDLTSSSVRQLFMIDKLYRVIGRADKNYESQFLAHYGVKIPHDVMHNITHIGHDMATIGINAVVSQSDTFNSETEEGAALGEIGGQGSVMLKGRKMNFKAPFHGVFMVICNIIPRFRYIAGFNKLHQLNSVTEFWQPEFDRRGAQPLFYYEAFGRNAADVNHPDIRLGWQFAYEQFKRKYDRCSHAFAPVGYEESKTGTVNSYTPWVVSSLPYSSFLGGGQLVATGNLGFYHFLSRPTDLNGIFQVPHVTSWNNAIISSPTTFKPWLIYQTDPFICDFSLKIKKVNGMSEYGEPEL